MRAPTLLALVTALGLSLAACGSGDDGKDPGAGGGGGDGGAPKKLTVTDLAGVVQRTFNEKKSVRASLAAEGELQGTFTLSTLNGAREMELVSRDADGPTHVLRLKDGIYSKDGEQPGKPWVKYPPNHFGAKLFGATLTVAEGILRSAEQRALIAAGGTITATKPEKVGAADTVRYTIKVDVPKALQGIDRKAFVTEHWSIVSDIATGKTQAKPDVVTDAQAENLARRFGAAMKGQPATYEYWVDAQGVPHKYSVTFPARKDTHAVITYSDWGTAKITPPPAGQIGAPPANPFGGN